MKKPVDELARLRRIILTLAITVFIFFIGVITWGSVEVARIKNAVTSVANQQPKIINGTNGQDGLNAYTPVKGKDYFDGENGVDGLNGRDAISTNTLIEKTIIKEVPIPGIAGAKGDTGKKLEISINKESCVIQTKYETDDLWTPLAQLPKPCEVQ